MKLTSTTGLPDHHTGFDYLFHFIVSAVLWRNNEAASQPRSTNSFVSLIASPTRFNCFHFFKNLRNVLHYCSGHPTTLKELSPFGRQCKIMEIENKKLVPFRAHPLPQWGALFSSYFQSFNLSSLLFKLLVCSSDKTPIIGSFSAFSLVFLLFPFPL